MKTLLCMLLLVASLLGQTIQLENLSPSAFEGWVRCTTDAEIPAAVAVDNAFVVRGPEAGLGVRLIDVRCRLAAGQRLSLDLSKGTETQWTTSPLPTDPIAVFGGPVLFAGQPMQLVDLRAEAAGYTVRLQARVGRMLHANLWLTWYPDTPAFARGELVLTASNPTIPDLTTTAPDMRLQFGDALVVIPGRGVGAPVVAPGTSFGDGQARVFPVLMVWLRNLTSASGWSSVGSLADHAVSGFGLQRLYSFGTPSVANGFDGRAWAGSHLSRGLQLLHSWDPPVLGPAANTGQTGAVEDQTFVGGEPWLGGAPAVTANYFAALKTCQHPMHHLELDGSIVSRARRPGLRMFYARPHRSGSDMLSKTADLQLTQTNGWNGPDAQHHTIGRLAAAARTTGSPACQHLLQHHVHVVLTSLTTDSSITSTIWSTREIGWEGIFYVLADEALADRVLAAEMAAHARSRARLIWVPFANKGGEVWDIRLDDLRLGAGRWWQPWQQAIACWGMDWVGTRFDVPEARAAAFRGAKRILRDVWRREGDRWVEYEHLCLDRDERTRSGFFTAAWLPLAVATVLQHEADEKALSVWAQIISDAGGNGRWIPPTR